MMMLLLFVWFSVFPDDEKHFGHLCGNRVKEPARRQFASRDRRWLLVVDGQVFVNVCPAAAFCELGSRVTVALQYPFGCQKSFDAHGTSCVYPGGADAHLGA
ncbi:unnamed protein product [Macrosiphum euphorbiae]|uniref:Secreted protein n=1 Tax=Macrosiphum euphorbiae TaxID=13131 RepID=A0AAV0W8D1_9HEMI|nr:unnamed protein product [Macrosiphum euphorbiae]